MPHGLLFLLQFSKATGKDLTLDVLLLLAQQRRLHGLVVGEAAD